MSLRERLSSSINTFLNRFGYAFVRIDGGNQITMHDDGYAYEHILVPDALAPWASDPTFLETWNAVKGNTLCTLYQSHELRDLVRVAAPIPGDIIEIGVWRGGSGAVLAEAAARWKPEATIWLCDTFTGVVKAGEEDPTYFGGEHADTSVGVVEALLAKMGLGNARILKGVFPDDTGERVPGQVALCHIDVDVYQSAADIIDWLLSRMPVGGIVVFDDYGYSSCKGITKLVDEIRDDGNWLFFHNLNKHAILIRR